MGTCRHLFGSLGRILLSSIALLPRPLSSSPPPPKRRRRNLGLSKLRPFALCRSMSLLSPCCWFFRTLWIRVSRALGVNRSCLYGKEIFFLVASRLSCALVFNWWNEIGNLGITSPINGPHQIALNSLILFISSQIRINFFGLNIK